MIGLQHALTMSTNIITPALLIFNVVHNFLHNKIEPPFLSHTHPTTAQYTFPVQTLTFITFVLNLNRHHLAPLISGTSFVLSITPLALSPPRLKVGLTLQLDSFRCTQIHHPTFYRVNSEAHCSDFILKLHHPCRKIIAPPLNLVTRSFVSFSGSLMIGSILHRK